MRASSRPFPPSLQLYEQFLSTFETRLNQLKFVQMLDAIAAQYIQSRPVDVVGACLLFCGWLMG